MPVLSMFYGIVVRMQNEKGGKHNTPHIHALYGDYEIVFSLECEYLEGDFPKKQRKLLEAWITLHEDELKANWALLNDGEGYFKIDPLK